MSGVEILRDVSFDIGAGEIHCVIGPNGGGKTSLIRSLLGQMPHTGRIGIDWNDSRITGYVPQLLDFDKTLPLTVNDFMAIVCHRHRPAFVGIGKSRRGLAAQALASVGLEGKGKTRFGSLSGGERQRALFAQALIPEPALLVLDEPMTSMDEIGEQVFARIIEELSESGVTVVWIAHDLAQVRAMADAVTCINGTVLFSGPPREVLTEQRAELLFSSAARAAVEAPAQ